MPDTLQFLQNRWPLCSHKVNEYSSLKDGPLHSWGDLGPRELFLRLGGLWFVTFTVLGVPIAAASFNPAREPLRFVLAAGTGTLFLVSLIILRIYLKHDIQELSSDDYFLKNNEFATWLKEERDVFFSDLSAEPARELFSEFIKEWNRGKLESRYYEGIASGRRTAHDWKIKV